MTADVGGSGAPRFDVVLRGYDRRQVDEHVGRLQRVLARMRADLEAARSQPLPLVPPAPGFGPGSPPPSAPRARPAPRARADQPDMIGTFTDRMQNILQAAEEEAGEIRAKARAAARAENESLRVETSDLLRQRDGLRAEVTRLRSQIEAIRGGPPGRINHSGDDADATRTVEPSPGRPSPTPGAARRPAQPSPSRGDGRTVAAPIPPAPIPPALMPSGPDRPRPAPAPANPPLPVSGGPHPVPSSGGVRRGSPPRPGPPRPGAPSPERRRDNPPGGRERDVSAPHPVAPSPGRPSPYPSQGPGESATVAASGDSGMGGPERPDAPRPHTGPPPSRSNGPTLAMKLPGSTSAGPGGPSSGAPGARPSAPGSDGRTTVVPRPGWSSTGSFGPGSPAFGSPGAGSAPDTSGSSAAGGSPGDRTPESGGSPSAVPSPFGAGSNGSTSGGLGRPGSTAAGVVSAIPARTPAPSGPAVTRLLAPPDLAAPGSTSGSTDHSRAGGDEAAPDGADVPPPESGRPEPTGSDESESAPEGADAVDAASAHNGSTNGSTQSGSGESQSGADESGPAQSDSAQLGLSEPSPSQEDAASGSAQPGEPDPGEAAAPEEDSVAAESESDSLWPQFASSKPASALDSAGVVDPTRPVDDEVDRQAAANGAAASASEATKRAAHRLPTGAHPIVGDAASMRPRSEPHPEPADLFRPAPPVEQKPPTDRPTEQPSEATVQVAAVRRPMPQDATVAAPSPPLVGRPDGRRG